MQTSKRNTMLGTVLATGLLGLPLAAGAGDGCTRDKGKDRSAAAPHGLHQHHAMQRMLDANGVQLHHAVYRHTGQAYRTGGYGMSDHSSKPSMDSGKPDIVNTAAQAGSFNTLIAALKAAGLDEVLRGEGPFTVFAPTDDAFAQIPQADLAALLADKAALTQVLTYHVVPGRVTASEVARLDSAETVQGSAVAIDTRDGVRVGGAKVVQTDIIASNGVIHVIDRVIIPN